MYPQFFDSAALGKSLREVAQEVLPKGQVNVVSRWFHGHKECDLFIWSDLDGNILKQQLSFFGQIIEWNVIEGLKTGLVIEEEGHNEQMGGSEIVRFDERPQMKPVEQAIELLNHMTALKDIERQHLLRNFADPKAGTNLPPEEFILRFGRFLDAPKPTPSQPSLWVRWKTRLKGLFR
jgi:hypothetical protein